MKREYRCKSGTVSAAVSSKSDCGKEVTGRNEELKIKNDLQHLNF
jgi:hypothetical protein